MCQFHLAFFTGKGKQVISRTTADLIFECLIKSEHIIICFNSKAVNGSVRLAHFKNSKRYFLIVPGCQLKEKADGHRCTFQSISVHIRIKSNTEFRSIHGTNLYFIISTALVGYIATAFYDVFIGKGILNACLCGNTAFKIIRPCIILNCC